MTCNLWREKAFALVEGLLPEPEARAYAAHLGACAACRAEVEESRGLVAALGRLPEVEMAPARAVALDRAVLARIHAGVRPAVPVAELSEGRAAAARAIAARSRRAGRPVFTPLPSLTFAALGLAAASILVALFLGDWIVRGMGGSFTVAVAALERGSAWVLERLGVEVIEAVTLLRIMRRLAGDLRPWVDAWRELVNARGQELFLAGGLVIVLLGLAGFVMRRDRTRTRDAARF